MKVWLSLPKGTQVNNIFKKKEFLKFVVWLTNEVFYRASKLIQKMLLIVLKNN